MCYKVGGLKLDSVSNDEVYGRFEMSEKTVGIKCGVVESVMRPLAISANSD